MTSKKINMSDSPTMQEHELVMFKRVQSRLRSLRGGMRIETHGPLIKALDRLSCVPFVSFPVQILWDPKIFIASEEAGTLEKPDVDVILKHSKPSPFGKGEETVMDETYRRGREISGADVTFCEDDRYNYDSFLSAIKSVVSAALFVPRNVKVKLYKLAIYREGGHFDWHKDTTHSDKHHATVLVALNTSWTGGDFILRRNGIETRMDMQPKVIPPRHKWEDPTTELRAVAFYTDTEHRVEPVTDGVRIVLQYDVEVVGWLSDKKDQGEGKKRKAEEDDDDEEENADNKKRKTEHEEGDQAEGTKRKETQDEDEDGDGGEDDDEDEDDDMQDEDDNDSDHQSNSDDMEVDSHSSTLDVIQEFSRKRKVLKNLSEIGDPAVVDDVIDIVGGLLTGGREEVAFALQYLYRKSSILPKFLKGSDSLLYQALSKTFDVSLHPVVLEETSDYEGAYGTMDSTFVAYKFDQGASANTSDDEGDEDEGDEGEDDEEDDGEDEDDEDDDGEEDDGEDDDKKKKPSIFFVSRSSAIEQLSHQSYVEYTGNEAMLGEDKYFGGGMFVRRKGAVQGA